jgi:hypothetical protein
MNRIQLFTKAGEHVFEILVAPNTPAPGNPDGTGCGRPVRNTGQLYWIDGIASDSPGRIYIGEVHTGKRAQKSVLQQACGQS